MILAEKIMNLRKKNGWSQEELAEKLNISRQSVSKWESGASIPDIDKIISMSSLFDVSTDYLLKDELENELPSETDGAFDGASARSVSLDEANSFMQLTKKTAVPIAISIAMFILCPAPLILLGGLQESGLLKIGEDAAGGLGVIILLTFIAVGVAILLLNALPLQKYDYLEKEALDLQYGVQGIVAKKKEQYADTFRLGLISGIICCILCVVPLMCAIVIFGENEAAVTCSIALLLLMIAIGVFQIVRVGLIQGSFNKLLQEGDYTVEKKVAEKKTAPFAGVYWCLTTAIFLAAGFITGQWEKCALIWPVAGVLFAGIQGVLYARAGQNRD